MDLSPQLLTSVAFKEQWRGYSQDEVDEFLERVAVAVGELQQRLREAGDRATEADRKLLDRTDQDEVRRTLVLAQRTAAQAIEEARSEAEHIVASAKATAGERVAEVQRRADELDQQVTERERTELASLAARRAALQADVAALEAFLDERRRRVRDELASVLDALDGVAAGGSSPTMSGVEVTAEPWTPEPEPAPEPVPSELVAAVPEAHEEAPVSSSVGEPTEHVDMASVLGEAEAAAGDDPSSDEPSSDEPSSDEPSSDEPEATAEATDGAPTGEHAAVTDESPEAIAPRWHDEDPEADPFLAELRRAVTDTEPLGPRDHDPSEALHLGEETDDGGGWFRLRRNRG